MPDCNETLHEMYTFLDGELPPRLKHDVESHLEGCTDCLGAFAFHVELKQVIVAKAAVEVMPAGLMDRIRACFGDDALDGVSGADLPGDTD
jgi:mycothiol system anti-sigma-R factor